MKALSLYQPWASFLAVGLKTIETRPKRTAHRGLMAVHAARLMPAGAQHAAEHLLQQDLVLEAALRFGLPLSLAAYPRGVVLGTVILEEIVPTLCLADRSRAPLLRGPERRPFILSMLEERLGDFSEGRWGWVMTAGGAQPFSLPVPARGLPGIWDWAPATS